MMLNFYVVFLKISVFVSVGRIFGACESGTKASTTVKILPSTVSSFSLPTNISPTSSLVSSFPSTMSIAIPSESAIPHLVTVSSTPETSILKSTFITSTVTESYQTSALNPSFASSGHSVKSSNLFTTMSIRTGSEILLSSFLSTSASPKSASITAYKTTTPLSTSITSYATSTAPLPSAITSTDTGLSTRVTQSQINPAQVSTVSVTSSIVMSSSVIVSSSPISTTTTTQKPTTMRATGDEEEDKTLVVGLSVGFSVAVVAIGCAIVIVIFWTRSSKGSSPSKSPEYADGTKEPPADDSDVSSLDSSSSDSCSFCKDDHTTYAGIVNPVNIMYENNPDIIFD